LVTIDEKLWFSVEAKLSETDASPHLYYFRKKLGIPFSYQVLKTGLKGEYMNNNLLAFVINWKF
jgi:hypothetical protein